MECVMITLRVYGPSDMNQLQRDEEVKLQAIIQRLIDTVFECIPLKIPSLLSCDGLIANLGRASFTRGAFLLLVYRTRHVGAWP